MSESEKEKRKRERQEKRERKRERQEKREQRKTESILNQLSMLKQEMQKKLELEEEESSSEDVLVRDLIKIIQKKRKVEEYPIEDKGKEEYEESSSSEDVLLKDLFKEIEEKKRKSEEKKRKSEKKNKRKAEKKRKIEEVEESSEDVLLRDLFKNMEEEKRKAEKKRKIEEVEESSEDVPLKDLVEETRKKVPLSKKKKPKKKNPTQDIIQQLLNQPHIIVEEVNEEVNEEVEKDVKTNKRPRETQEEVVVEKKKKIQVIDKVEVPIECKEIVKDILDVDEIIINEDLWNVDDEPELSSEKEQFNVDESLFEKFKKIDEEQEKNKQLMIEYEVERQEEILKKQEERLIKYQEALEKEKEKQEDKEREEREIQNARNEERRKRQREREEERRTVILDDQQDLMAEFEREMRNTQPTQLMEEETQLIEEEEEEEKEKGDENTGIINLLNFFFDSLDEEEVIRIFEELKDKLSQLGSELTYNDVNEILDRFNARNIVPLEHLLFSHISDRNSLRENYGVEGYYTENEIENDEDARREGLEAASLDEDDIDTIMATYVEEEEEKDVGLIGSIVNFFTGDSDEEKKEKEKREKEKMEKEEREKEERKKEEREKEEREKEMREAREIIRQRQIRENEEREEREEREREEREREEREREREEREREREEREEREREEREREREREREEREREREEREREEREEREREEREREEREREREEREREREERENEEREERENEERAALWRERFLSEITSQTDEERQRMNERARLRILEGLRENRPETIFSDTSSSSEENDYEADGFLVLEEPPESVFLDLGEESSSEDIPLGELVRRRTEQNDRHSVIMPPTLPSPQYSPSSPQYSPSSPHYSPSSPQYSPSSPHYSPSSPQYSPTSPRLPYIPSSPNYSPTELPWPSTPPRPTTNAPIEPPAPPSKHTPKCSDFTEAKYGKGRRNKNIAKEKCEQADPTVYNPPAGCIWSKKLCKDRTRVKGQKTRARKDYKKIMMNDYEGGQIQFIIRSSDKVNELARMIQVYFDRPYRNILRLNRDNTGSDLLNSYRGSENIKSIFKFMINNELFIQRSANLSIDDREISPESNSKIRLYIEIRTEIPPVFLFIDIEPEKTLSSLKPLIEDAYKKALGRRLVTSNNKFVVNNEIEENNAIIINLDVDNGSKIYLVNTMDDMATVNIEEDLEVFSDTNNYLKDLINEMDETGMAQMDENLPIANALVEVGANPDDIPSALEELLGYNIETVRDLLAKKNRIWSRDYAHMLDSISRNRNRDILQFLNKITNNVNIFELVKRSGPFYSQQVIISESPNEYGDYISIPERSSVYMNKEDKKKLARWVTQYLKLVKFELFTEPQIKELLEKVSVLKTQENEIFGRTDLVERYTNLEYDLEQILLNLRNLKRSTNEDNLNNDAIINLFESLANQSIESRLSEINSDKQGRGRRCLSEETAYHMIDLNDDDDIYYLEDYETWKPNNRYKKGDIVRYYINSMSRTPGLLESLIDNNNKSIDNYYDELGTSVWKVIPHIMRLGMNTKGESICWSSDELVEYIISVKGDNIAGPDKKSSNKNLSNILENELPFNPLKTTINTNIITVTDRNHGKGPSDKITLVGADWNVVGISGDKINGTHEITRIVDQDHYEFEASDTVQPSGSRIKANATSSIEFGSDKIGIAYEKDIPLPKYQTPYIWKDDNEKQQILSNDYAGSLGFDEYGRLVEELETLIPTDAENMSDEQKNERRQKVKERRNKIKIKGLRNWTREIKGNLAISNLSKMISKEFMDRLIKIASILWSTGPLFFEEVRNTNKLNNSEKDQYILDHERYDEQIRTGTGRYGTDRLEPPDTTQKISGVIAEIKENNVTEYFLNHWETMSSEMKELILLVNPSANVIERCYRGQYCAMMTGKELMRLYNKIILYIKGRIRSLQEKNNLTEEEQIELFKLLEFNDFEIIINVN
jgi:hypothetical protein